MGSIYLGSQKIMPVVVVSGGSPTPPTPTSKYQLFEMVKNDSNNNVGIVGGFFTDHNDIEYAVVFAMDNEANMTAARYNFSTVANIPVCNNLNSTSTSPFEIGYTATEMTDAQVSTNTAAQYCQQFSHVIGGHTYLGQLMNVPEVLMLVNNFSRISTATGVQGLTGGNSLILTSTQSSITTNAHFAMYWNSSLANKGITSMNYCLWPVYELPNAL